MTGKEKELFKDAEKSFNSENYKKALINYSQILNINPENDKAKILVILTEMVMNKESGGDALYDYYTILIKANISNPEDVIYNLLESIDNKKVDLGNLPSSALEEHLLYSDGITYTDFKAFAIKQKGFKKAFEDIIFTTKIIITEKEELLDFLNNLVKYEFYGTALSYLEGALESFPNDKSLQFLAKKLNIGNNS